MQGNKTKDDLYEDLGKAITSLHGTIASFSRNMEKVLEVTENSASLAEVLETMDAFTDVEIANTSFSYHLITHLPLKTYIFKYDTIENRQHLGVLGPDIISTIPESVSILPKRSIREKGIEIRNFHVVDKHVLFMHNVAATKYLIDKAKDFDKMIYSLKQQLNAHTIKHQIVEKRLEQEAAIELIEKRKLAEAEIEKTKIDMEMASVKAQEEKNILDYRKKTDTEIEEMRNRLANERLEVEDKTKRNQNKELVQLQEASSLRLEQKRRETNEYLQFSQMENEKQKALIEKNTTIERTQLEIEGRIKQQRENQDIEMQQLEARAKADHKKMLDAIQKTFDNLGQGFLYIVMDQNRLYTTIAAIVLLAAGIYISRETIRLLGHFLEQHLGRPSLVRETSRTTGILGFFKSLFGRKYTEKELADVVLPSELTSKIYELARATKNARKHKAPFRHILLYGPPGTGKTMVAKRLARCSGMDYAIMSGGDVGPLGSDAVTQLHSIFRWAKACPRGVLLFIDEAEAFLGSRGKKGMTEAMRNALNALLYQTGEQSSKFMMVIATNRPGDLDIAVTDRIDETLHFELPGDEERANLLKMYYKKYITDICINSSRKKRNWWTINSSILPLRNDLQEINTSLISDKHLLQFVPKTEGLSGREISKLMIYLQSVVYSQVDRTLTVKLFSRVVAEKVKEHERKKDLRKAQCKDKDLEEEFS